MTIVIIHLLEGLRLKLTQQCLHTLAPCVLSVPPTLIRRGDTAAVDKTLPDAGARRVQPRASERLGVGQVHRRLWEVGGRWVGGGASEMVGSRWQVTGGARGARTWPVGRESETKSK